MTRSDQVRLDEWHADVNGYSITLIVPLAICDNLKFYMQLATYMAQCVIIVPVHAQPCMHEAFSPRKFYGKVLVLPF